MGVAGVITPCLAAAQDAGVTLTDPAPVVRAARGTAAPRAERSVRARSPGDTLVPIHTVRGECYEVLGYATGAAQVRAQVMARTAEVGEALSLANSSGQAVRGRFCADLGGALYALRVHAEGPAWWAVAVVPVASGADAGVAPPPPPPAVDAGTVANRPAAVVHPPVGGTEQDYVGGQVRAYAVHHGGLVGLAVVVRRALATNETYEAALPLTSGHCVDVVAAGVPSVGDLVIELEDPSGNRVAQDSTHQGTEAVHYCPAYAGSYRLRVRMFSGQGLTAIQALTEP